MSRSLSMMGYVWVFLCVQVQQQSLWSRLDQLELLAAQTEVRASDHRSTGHPQNPSSDGVVFQEDQWRQEAASAPQSTLPASVR